MISSKPHRFARMHRQSASLFARKLTEIFLLVLMMWPAPMPVGHRHSDCSSRVSADILAQHLQRFHGGIANSENWPDEWHWHWVFPTDICGNLDGDAAHSHHAQMAPVRNADLPALLLTSCRDVGAHPRSVGRSCIPRERQHSFHSLTVLRSGLSLPELLGVVRC